VISGSAIVALVAEQGAGALPGFVAAMKAATRRGEGRVAGAAAAR
jgi:hypothetical protein